MATICFTQRGLNSPAKGNNQMLDVKTTLKTPAPVFKPEMLVSHADGSVGIVTKISRHWIHVLWLVNTSAPFELTEDTLYKCADATEDDLGSFYCPSKLMVNTPDEGKYHFVGWHKKKELTICPVGTTVTITQTEKAQ